MATRPSVTRVQGWKSELSDSSENLKSTELELTKLKKSYQCVVKTKKNAVAALKSQKKKEFLQKKHAILYVFLSKLGALLCTSMKSFMVLLKQLDFKQLAKSGVLYCAPHIPHGSTQNPCGFHVEWPKPNPNLTREHATACQDTRSLT